MEVTAQFAQLTDNGPPFSLKLVATDDITLDLFALPGVLIQGIAKAELLLTNNLSNGTITFNEITTQSISLSDDANAATSVSYSTITYFGRGNLTGQTGTLYVKYQDTLIKIGQPENGGWRIDKRKVILVVCQLSSLLSDICVGSERRRVHQLTWPISGDRRKPRNLSSVRACLMVSFSMPLRYQRWTLIQFQARSQQRDRLSHILLALASLVGATFGVQLTQWVREDLEWSI